MPLLSKPLTDEQKEQNYKRMLEAGILAVLVQNSVLLGEPEMMSECVGGDPKQVASAMALSSSISGMIEFVVNPILGKMADKYGRKFIYYLGPLLSGASNLALVLNKGKNLNLNIAARACNWSLISISNSFIAPICMSDMFSGQELGIRVAKFFGSFGAPVVLVPVLATAIQKYTGSSLNLFKARLLLCLIQLGHSHFCIKETLLEERKKPFDIAAANPFSFLRLFGTKSTKSLRTLVSMLFLSMLAEGKNLISLMQTWMKTQPMWWGPEKVAAGTMAYGIFMIGSGMVMAPKLIKTLGPRGFTSLTCISNALAYLVIHSGLPSFDVAYWVGLVLHSLGINNTNASAIKAAATDHAVAYGYGRGEYGGMASSLRSVALIVSPALCNWAYRPSTTPNSKSRPGFPYLLLAFVAAALPELLHRSLSDAEFEVPKKPEATGAKA